MVVGVVLAGGRATRMGGQDKALIALGGKPLIAHVIAKVAPQCAALAINANGDAQRFAALDLPVIADDIADHAGPLAGIKAGLAWACAHHPDAAWLLSAPADTPFLPDDLVARLLDAADLADADIAVAASGGQVHHAVALWRPALRADLREALTVDGVRAIHRFTQRHACISVEWTFRKNDPFFNINDADDLTRAEKSILR